VDTIPNRDDIKKNIWSIDLVHAMVDINTMLFYGGYIQLLYEI
jgi:hypothetical protein